MAAALGCPAWECSRTRLRASRRQAASRRRCIVGGSNAFPGECWVAGGLLDPLRGPGSSFSLQAGLGWRGRLRSRAARGAVQRPCLKSIPGGMLGGGWFVVSILFPLIPLPWRVGRHPLSRFEEHSPGNVGRRLVRRIRPVSGGSIRVARCGAPTTLLSEHPRGMLAAVRRIHCAAGFHCSPGRGPASLLSEHSPGNARGGLFVYPSRFQ
jgi:hypothetical protein